MMNKETFLKHQKQFIKAVDSIKNKNYPFAKQLLTELSYSFDDEKNGGLDFPILIEYLLYIEKPQNEKQLKILRTKEPVCMYYYYLGITNMAMGNLDDAINNFKSSIKYNPRCVVSMIELAGIYLKKSLFELAYDMILQSLEFAYLTEHFSLSYHLLGQYYYNNVQYEIANACYFISLHYNPDSKINLMAIKQIEDTIGETFKFTSIEDFKALFMKYHLRIGPSEYLLKVIQEFTTDAMNSKNYQIASYLTRLAYNLTKANHYKELLEKIDTIS